MAKMFYTMQETMTALGRNEEGIKQLAREGRLREFRDGPRLMFKADQVEQLKSELGGGGGGGGEVPLAADSGAPLSLAGDTRGGSTAGGLSLGDSHVGARPAKEDTQFADIGLSGSLGGSLGGTRTPSAGTRPGTGAPIGSGSGILNLGGTGAPVGSGLGSTGSRGGITVFDVDESQRVDPMAQTAINAGMQDQINLEGVGSGSGLLDLTRESDDTSLGAVFDELQPGQRPARGGAAPVAMPVGGGDFSAPAVDRSAGGRTQLAAPIYVEAADPLAHALGWAALVVSAILVFCGFILTAALMGYRPDIVKEMAWEASGKMYLMLAAGVTLVFGVIGFVIGKMSSK